MKLNNKRTILVGLAFLSICAFWETQKPFNLTNYITFSRICPY